jgi:hypothetical protein
VSFTVCQSLRRSPVGAHPTAERGEPVIAMGAGLTVSGGPKGVRRRARGQSLLAFCRGLRAGGFIIFDHLELKDVITSAFFGISSQH